MISRLQASELESRPSRCRECYEITSAFGGIADMAGLAAGSTQSRMDPERTKRGSFVAIRRLGPTVRREMWALGLAVYIR